MTDHLEAGGHKGDVSLDRLLFFSDGVFAIAITLLSIELHAPEGWNGTLVDLWARGWRMFSAFAVSFAVVGIFWNTHRRIFSTMTRYDIGVFVLNLLLLGAIVLMPFVSSLLYAGAGPGPFFIYIGLVSVAGVLQGLVYGYAAFVADLLRPRLPWPRRMMSFLTIAVLPGAYCALTLFAIGRAWSMAAVLGGVLALLMLSRSLIERRFSA